MKKFIIVMMAVFMTFLLVACDKEPTNANISNAEESYLTFTYNNKVVKITKGEIYQRLKLAYGADVAIDSIDTKTLKETKNSNSKSYWELVTTKEIEDALNEEITASKTEEQNEEEAKNAFLESIQDQGYDTFEVYKEEVLHLQLAKKKYAIDCLTKEIKAQDEKASESDTDEEYPYFKDVDYEAQLASLYPSKYFGIVLTYNTIKQAEEAFAQLGITVPVNPDGEKSWVWTNTNTPLTTNEIVKAYIDLYNNRYAGITEGYPTNLLPLTENVQYKVVNGKIVFNTEVASEEDDNAENINRLYYTASQINKINSAFGNYFLNTMKVYDAETSQASGEKWYTYLYKQYSGLYVYALKISSVDAPELETVKDEVYQSLFDTEITEEYIDQKMAELRKTTNFVIYDSYMEELYASAFSAYYEVSDESSDTLVAKNDYLEVKADDLFTKLDKLFGKLYIGDIAFQRAVLHSKYNDIYDVDKKEILDAEAWNEIADQITTIESTYNSQYASALTWENYLFYQYGAYSTEELKMALLYQVVLSKYGTELASLTDVASWAKYKEKMEEKVNNYYSLDYYQIVVGAVDEKGNTVYFDDWTDYQKDLGKIIIDAIWNAIYNDYNYKGDVVEMFEDIYEEYKKAPVLSTLGTVEIVEGVINYEEAAKPGDAQYDFLGIPLAAAKSAGLTIKYEAEATFTNSSSYVQEFLDLGKYLWSIKDVVEENDNEDGEYFLKSFMKDGVEEKYLTTTYGYHAYINTGFNNLATYSVTTDKFVTSTVLKNTPYILPSFEMVEQYLIDAGDANLTSSIKNSISTYFTPLQTELSGVTYAQREALKEFKALTFNFNGAQYTASDFQKAIADQIESINAKLTYFKDVE